MLKLPFRRADIRSSHTDFSLATFSPAHLVLNINYFWSVHCCNPATQNGYYVLSKTEIFGRTPFLLRWIQFAIFFLSHRVTALFHSLLVRYKTKTACLKRILLLIHTIRGDLLNTLGLEYVYTLYRRFYIKY